MAELLPNSSCEVRKESRKMLGVLLVLIAVCALLRLMDKTPSEAQPEVQIPKPTVQVLYVDIHFHRESKKDLGFGSRSGKPDPPEG